MQSHKVYCLTVGPSGEKEAVTYKKLLISQPYLARTFDNIALSLSASISIPPRNMATLSEPSEPLRILTIDGGGLQGVSTLLILQRLLNSIAKNNGGADGKPRPCDVFDVIAGIGSGGWLALLLGRFQMDVGAALSEWYNLIDCIEPRSKVEQLRMRVLQHCYFDTDRLVDQVDELTKFYETDKHMFLAPQKGTRCKHVFVSALKTDSKDRHLGYSLFRTYECPEGSNVLEGPPNPREYKISHAFGATGAAKYFTPPWIEPTAKKGMSKFLDIQFPKPHNITELALNEMWGLYGKDVKISAVVNIGPGIPNAPDCRNIAGRFSLASKEIGSPALLTRLSFFGAKKVNIDSQSDHISPAPAGDAERRTPVARQTTFGSELQVGIEEKLRKDESMIESDIKKKLQNVYPEHTPLYYRLAPESSAPGTAQNDTSTPKALSDYTQQYLHTSSVEAAMEEIGQHLKITMAAG